MGILLQGLYVIAKNGDSLVVKTHDNVLIRTNPAVGGTSYSGWGKFGNNGKTYSKVYAELTMECPPGENCGEWDYLNFISIGKRKGTHNDTLNWEIMRFITAYGKYWTGAQKWKHGWRWDITDFASLLTDSVEIVYQHTGYETNVGRGWVINLSFTMIEGVPERNIISARQIFRNSCAYDSASKFDKATPPISVNYNAKTKTARYKIIQTGHGGDNTENCSEFCPKKRYLFYDGTQKDEAYVWRDNCGLNPLYPQFGTWLLDRANWCPGSEVEAYNFDITAETSTSHTFDLDMEDYNAKAGGANYMITIWLIEFDSANFKTDAEIVDVVSPSTDYRFLRNNPICSEPVVRVKNNGTTHIGAMAFEYGVKGAATKNNYWRTVDIDPGATQDITLTRFQDWGTPKEFYVKITSVNDKPSDDYVPNNQSGSLIPQSFPPVWPEKIIVLFKTNNAPLENSFVILDAANNIVYHRKKYVAATTVYRDTIQLYKGCFTFVFYDTGQAPAQFDLRKDGIDFWANTYDGTGALQIRNGNTGSMISTVAGDFGTEYRTSFNVGWALNNQNAESHEQIVKVFPNPAQKEFMVDLGVAGTASEKAEIQLIDLNGKTVNTVLLKNNFSALQAVKLNNVVPGVYLVKVLRNNEAIVKKILIN